MNICECIFGTSRRFALNRKKKISLPNPPLEQSFNKLEFLDEEKIGGETMVSLLKFLGSMVL